MSELVSVFGRPIEEMSREEMIFALKALASIIQSNHEHDRQQWEVSTRRFKERAAAIRAMGQ